MSLIKTLSQASFNQIPSGTNLKALENTYSNMNNGSNGQRSLSVPTDAYHYHTNNVEKSTSKKEKEKEKHKKGEGDPGMLEFVKVDVENNMVRFFFLCQQKCEDLSYASCNNAWPFPSCF